MTGTTTSRRSTGRMQVTRALWYAAPGRIELRPASLAAPGPGQARVRTLYTAVSRGTERLVFEGRVSPSEWERMRAPAQEGEFPFPVKYGYCATGVVEDGPDALLGRTVFALHPHQDTFVLAADRLTPVPDGVPARRATLAANMETALNAHWDAGTGPGDRIAIVGAGVVGLLVASIAARIPGADVTVFDVNPGRKVIVEALGARFVASGGSPGNAAATSGAAGPQPVTPRAKPPAELVRMPAASRAGRVSEVARAEWSHAPPWSDGRLADVVFHASAHEAGLAAAIGLAGPEARIVELSWYGDRAVTVALGGPFHSQRLQLISSQVGQVATSRRARWDYRRRLEAALRLLDDPRLDALVADEIAFEDAPVRLPSVFDLSYPGLAPVLKY